MRRIFKILGPTLLLVMGCYWPTAIEESYVEEVAINVLLVAGRPIDSLWITKTRGVFEPYDSTAQLTDSNRTRILIYEGTDLSSSPLVDTLRPVTFDTTYPHDCYFGTDTIEANKMYSLHAEVFIAGTDSAITLTATTMVPAHVSLDSQTVPLIVYPKGQRAFAGNLPKLKECAASGLDLSEIYVPAADSDTIVYQPGDSFFSLSYFFFPQMPVANAEGFFIMNGWSDSIWINDTLSVFKNDTLSYPAHQRERLYAIPYLPDLDRLFFSNGFLQMAGLNTFSIFALDTAALRYELYLNQPEHYSNIEGGYGFFGSATVDSISFYVEPGDAWTRLLTDSLKSALDSIKAAQDSLEDLQN